MTKMNLDELKNQISNLETLIKKEDSATPLSVICALKIICEVACDIKRISHSIETIETNNYGD